jgi:enamine deaminase RidA (YjgF/YER057c/UK114 family)
VDRPLTRHRVVNPPELAQPTGYSHAIVAQPGRTIYLAGQTAQRADGSIAGITMAEQFDQAASNLATALRAAGGQPSDLVSMQIFVTDIEEYLRSRREIRAAYQRQLGDHYPAMGLFQVNRLFDPTAKVELMAVAVTADG